TFNASSSSSSAPNATLQFRWDWTDDGTWDTPWSTDPIAEHAYTPAGVYTAELQVQDSLGSTNETTHPIPVDDAPPVTTASLSGLLNGSVFVGPILVTLTATDVTSGVANTSVSIDGLAGTNYTLPFLVPNIGTHSVVYFSFDRAGNAEAAKEFSVVNG